MKHCSESGAVVPMSQKCNRIDVGGGIRCVESPSRGNVDFHALFLCFVRVVVEGTRCFGGSRS